MLGQSIIDARITETKETYKQKITAAIDEHFSGKEVDDMLYYYSSSAGKKEIDILTNVIRQESILLYKKESLRSQQEYSKYIESLQNIMKQHAHENGI